MEEERVAGERERRLGRRDTIRVGAVWEVGLCREERTGIDRHIVDRLQKRLR